jgi:hypothetical protein
MAKSQAPISIRRVGTLLLAILLVVTATAAYVTTRPEPKVNDYRDPQSYVGLTEAEAIERAQAGGLVHRVIRRDGSRPPSTDGYNTNRVNFTIDNSKVSGASIH